METKPPKYGKQKDSEPKSVKKYYPKIQTYAQSNDKGLKEGMKPLDYYYLYVVLTAQIIIVLIIEGAMASLPPPFCHCLATGINNFLIMRCDNFHLPSNVFLLLICDRYKKKAE